MSRYPHAAPSRSVRLDARWIGLGLMCVSATVVVAVGWVALAFLLSLSEYVPSQVLP